MGRAKGLPKGGALYGAGANKAAGAMIKQYGPAKGRVVFYSLANKRSGKGTKGKDRMHNVATTAYAKGSHWKSIKGKRTVGSRKRIRG